MSTYEPIASQTLGSAAASVTFSSIPQGYTDLVVVMNVISSSTAANYIYVQYNNDTGSNYSTTILSGDGSSAQSARSSNRTNFNIDYYATPNTEISNRILQIQNYSNSTTFKTGLVRANRAGGGTDAIVGLWRSTAAINQLKITHDTANFASGSTFSLYGIQVGDKAQKAQGGNIVTSDGTYVYHTFTSSGAFIPNQALTVDYLVVAGGAGGGYSQGGGGGAGGLRCTVGATGGGGSLESALSLTAKSYPVIVGAGGAGSTSLQAYGANGSNSIFSTITSTGGGGGATGGQNGQNGGSGGGAGNGGSIGTGTANQGYNGGTAYNGGNYYGGGGGGGAGAVGGNGSSGAGGNGGNGVTTSISGTSTTYAGGGGAGTFTGGTAGTGGSGGGGNAGNYSTGQAGFAATANTGSGGGGSSYGPSFPGSAGPGGNGGSGIVIIRYLA